MFVVDGLCVLAENADFMTSATFQRTYSGLVTLAYLDPPFFTGRDFKTSDGQQAFGDRWYSLQDYIDALAKRVRLVREALAPHGSMYLHLDSRAVHYAKVMADEVFGYSAFKNEIVWRYRRWPSRTTDFQRMHDTILRYVKDPTATPRWNQLYDPLSDATRRAWGTKKQEREEKRSRSTDEESPGVAMCDVWDIKPVGPNAGERVGYPTQKPMELLQRIVEASTDPGDLILDPYMGSGTLAEVAARNSRNYVGIDASVAAFRTTTERLKRHGYPFQGRSLLVA